MEHPARTPMLERLGPFRHRPFALYWAGGLLSNLGTWLQTVAASIFVYQLTGSALAVGFLNFAGFVPILLFSVAGGMVSDRFDRRRVVILAHVVSTAAAGVLAALTLSGSVDEVHLVVTAFVLNTAYAIAKPSLTAILPSLVPRDEITDAAGLNSLQFVLGQIAGPVIATVVIAFAGAGWAFLANALTYLGPIASMVYLQRLHLGANRPQDLRPAAPATRAGAAPSAGRADHAPHDLAASAGAIAFVRQQPWVLALLIGVVATSAPMEAVRTLSPAIATEALGAAGGDAGLVVAAQAAGSALALLLFVPLRRRGFAKRMRTLGFAIQALGLALTALAPSLVVGMAGVALDGFGFSLVFPILTGTLQAEVPDAMRGRVMAFHQMAHLGNRPFTALAVGSLAAAFGVREAVLAAVVLAPLGILATRRAWRLLDAGAAQVEDATDPAGLAAPRSSSAGGAEARLLADDATSAGSVAP
ncbi:MAG: MFS transporter [Candidatus Limnocylindrales bacterium]